MEESYPKIAPIGNLRTAKKNMKRLDLNLKATLDVPDEQHRCAIQTVMIEVRSPKIVIDL